MISDYNHLAQVIYQVNQKYENFNTVSKANYASYSFIIYNPINCRTISSCNTGKSTDT
jgi:hypothetical protein